MANNTPTPGAHHEQQGKLNPDRREAALVRWPIRHHGPIIGERALFTMFPDMLAKPATQPVEPRTVDSLQSLASSAVTQASESAQSPTLAAMPYQGEVPVNDVDRLRREVASKYDQKAA